MEGSNPHITPIDLLTKLLANEANASEVQLANEWIASSDVNTREFESLKKLWNEVNKVKDIKDIDLEKEWQKMDRVISKGKIISLKRVLQLAASIIILGVLSFLALQQISITANKTKTAEIREFKLPDGSTVSLNANSKISYKKGFGTDHRNLVLTGEAYFDVTKNNNLAFTISAYNARIQVVGTRFYVKAYKENPEIKVIVDEGKVKFCNKKKPQKEILLSTGQSGSFLKEEQIIQEDTIHNINEIAWKTHRFSFNNTTIEEAVKMLGKAFHKQIDVKENIKNCSVTVTFEDLDLNGILEVLKSTLDLKISTDGNRIIISGQGCN